jgi:amino acid adenylation domain-containing protein
VGGARERERRRRIGIRTDRRKEDRVSTVLDPPAFPSAADAPVTEPAARRRFELSFGQERLWFIDRLRPDTRFVNGATYVLRGPLDVDALRRAVAEVVRRQDSLRTVFEEVDGRGVAVVLPEIDAALETVDFEGRPDEAQAWMRQFAARPFDTARGPLFRVALVRLADDEHVLVPMLHNLVSDGWSLYVVFHEIAALYGAFAEGRPSPLPEIAVSYGEYSARQRERFSGEALERELEWWRRKLAGARTLHLPADRPRPAVPDFRSPMFAVTVPRPTAEALWLLARREGVSLFTVLLAAYQVVAGRWAGTTDVLVGGAAANRDRREAQGLVGFFLTTLPLRADLSGDPTFRSLLPTVLESVFEASRHGELPFERLVAELEPGGDLTASQLCSTCFVLHNAPWPGQEAAGVAMEMNLLGNGLSRFDLIVSARQTEEGLYTLFQYRRDVFEESTMRRFADDYALLLEEVVRDPDRPVSRYPLPAAGERRAQAAEPAAASAENDTTDRQGDDGALAETIARVLADVLGADRVGADEDFFARGGHWNQAPRVASRLGALLGADVPVGAVFEAPTAAGLARRIAPLLPRGGNGRGAASHPSPESSVSPVAEAPAAAPATGDAPQSISPTPERAADAPRLAPPDARPPRAGDFPLSFGQERVWLAEQVDPGTSAWNVILPVRLRGPLDVGALQAALDECVRRHAALRTTFPQVDDLPVQRIAPTGRVPVRVDELGGAGVDELNRRLAEESGRSFELERGPLARLTLFRVAPDDHAMLLVIHHIVGDGWSLGVLFRELGALYGAALRGEPSPLAEPAADYADFALWQRERLTDAALARPLAYWRRALAGAPAVLDLPSDRPGPAAPGARALTGTRLSAAAVERAGAIAREEAASAFMVMLAVHGALLSGWTGADDVVVGIPHAGRMRPETQSVVGFFVNSLPIRLDLSGDPGFRELVRRARDSALGAFEHAEAPFEKIVQAVRPTRARGQNPLFQVMFAPQPLPSLEFAGLAAERAGIGLSFSTLPILMSVAEDTSGALIGVQYAPDMFDAKTAERMAARYVRLLETAVAQPDLSLSQLWAQSADAADEGDVRRPAASPSSVAEETAAGAPSHPAHAAGDDAPRTAMERLLAGMWTELLDVEHVGVHDDFFELGGHSLVATQLVSRVRRAVNVDLTVRTVLDAPTLHELAAELDTLLAARATASDTSGDGASSGDVNAAASAPSEPVASPAPVAAAQPVHPAAPASADTAASAATLAGESTASASATTLDVAATAATGTADRGATTATSTSVESGIGAEADESAARVESTPTAASPAHEDRGAEETGEREDAHLPDAANEPAQAAARLEELQRNGASVFPQSFAQQRLWFLDQMMPGTPVYNVPVGFRLRGELNVDALHRTLNELLRRHESLRTVLASLEGLPVQVVLPRLEIPLPVDDLSRLAPEEREAEARRITLDESRWSFDLSRAPLIRARLLRVGDREHLLRLVIHHAVSDGWSLGVLFREMGVLYAAFAAGRPSPLAELEVQYADFSVWQREWLRGPVLERQLAWWRPVLAGAPERLELPTDRARPFRPTWAGDGYRVDIPAALVAEVGALARRESTTPYMVLLAAVKALLARWSGQTDLIVGAPVANRTRPEVEPLVGFFVNTLPLRTDLGGDPAFTELLARVREVTLGAFAHQDVPLERLVEELAPGRDGARPPLFQVAFVLQNAPWTPLELNGLRMELETLETGTSRFDLTFSLREAENGGIRGRMEYSSELFDEATMRGVHADLVGLLEAVIAEPGARISQLPLPFVEQHRRAHASQTASGDGDSSGAAAASASPSPASPPIAMTSADADRETSSAPSASPADEALRASAAPRETAVADQGEAKRPEDATQSASPASPPVVVADAEIGLGAEVRVAPQSFTQERFWMAHRLDPAGAGWNVPHVRRLRGALDPSALERALGEIVRRHEPLRTTLELRAGQPVQVVRELASFRLPVVDLRHLPIAHREPEAMRLAQDAVERAFDLATGPVLRIRLMRLDEEDHLMAVVIHHAATDGWSMGVIIGELDVLYEAFGSGAPSPLAPLPQTYADHAEWERWWLSGERLDRELSYWRKRLEGAPPALELPLDRPRPAGGTLRGEYMMLEVPADVAGRVRAFARSEDATLFMVLLAAWASVLSRWSGQADVVVGTPVAHRNRRETEPLVGAFVNTLPLRTDLSGEPSLRELVARTREATLEALGHQDLPFEKLVDALGVGRTPARHPVFQVMFALQNTPVGRPRPGGLRGEGVAITAGSSPFDLDLLLGERPGGGEMQVLLEYSCELFERATAERLFRHFVRLLDAGAAQPDTPVAALELMDAAERRQVLVEWNATATAYPRHATIPSLFAEVAARAPGAVALTAVEGGARTSFGELEARANRLARHLRARGVTTGDRVALSMERSPDAIVAMLAVLKAGASYVPLDPAYPDARAATILADAGCKVVVVHDAAVVAHAVPVVSLLREADEIAARDASALPLEAAPASEAYVIYTSGSTGRPKGVSVPHRGIVRLVRDTNLCDWRADDVTLALTALTFDVSAVEIWGALLNGGSLAVFPPRVPALGELAAAIRDHGVTLARIPNALFNEMVDRRPADLTSLRALDVGGEAMSVAHARRALERLPSVRLVNNYGPTENSVVTTRRFVRAEDTERASIPIGEPVSNTRVYVLDERLRPVPVGLPGELCAAGDGLATGYVGLPGFTAERFVEVELGDGLSERVYRTRDRARWLPGGTIEFLGRLDDQIKIRGFRVEPGEIEAALRSHPGVRDAAVAARDDETGSTRLVAYVVPTGAGSADAAELRAHLRGSLPEYMLPSAFVTLPALPATPSGKVDRRALPAPEALEAEAAAAANADAPAAAPRTALERRIAAYWAEVLRTEPVGLDDNFFERGGNSLLLTLLHARLDEEFPGLGVQLMDLFRHPTVRTLAEHLAAAGAASPDVRTEGDAEPSVIPTASASPESVADAAPSAVSTASAPPESVAADADAFIAAPVARVETEPEPAISIAAPATGGTAEEDEVATVAASPVAFLFPGLGDQYPGMGRGLYEADPAFRRAVDRCAEILLPLGIGVRDALWPAGLEHPRPSSNGGGGLDFRKMVARGAAAPDPHAERLNRTEVAQPVAFVIGYALAKAWEGRGIAPQAVIGHSLGEYTAACIAGVFSLRDALTLVAERARLISALPGGAMLAVPLSEEAVRPHLVPGAVVAAVNAPDTCVVAGPEDAVEEVARRMAAAGHATRRLPTTHAFHTPMMAAAADRLTALAARVRLSPPRIPIVSNVTGTWMTAGEATDPSYWARHLTQPVRFSAGVDTLLSDSAVALVEVGPGQSLGTFVRQRAARPGQRPPAIVSSLRNVYEEADDAAYLQSALDRVRAALAGEDAASPAVETDRGAAEPPIAPRETASVRADAVAEDEDGFRSVLPRGLRIAAKDEAPDVASGDGALLGVEESDWAAVRRVELEVDGSAEGVAAFLRSLGFQVSDGNGDGAAAIRRLTAVRAAAPAPRAAPREADAPAPPSPQPTSSAAHAPGEVEQGVAAIWQELLGAAPRPDDDFFLLGGHSLLATELLWRVRARFGVELSLVAVFRARTLTAFASVIEQALNLEGAVALTEEEALGMM